MLSLFDCLFESLVPTLLQGYLGSVDAGKNYDATSLISTYNGPNVPILIDQVIFDLLTATYYAKMIF